MPWRAGGRCASARGQRLRAEALGLDLGQLGGRQRRTAGLVLGLDDEVDQQLERQAVTTGGLLVVATVGRDQALARAGVEARHADAGGGTGGVADAARVA